MKVSEFIEWLETQDQEATVEVVVRVPATGWGGDSVSVVEFTPELSYYVDLRGNPFMKDNSPIKDSRTLLLGES